MLLLLLHSRSIVYYFIDEVLYSVTVILHVLVTMADVLRGGSDYQTVFDPDAYLKGYHIETSENWPFIISYMESFQKIYCQGNLSILALIQRLLTINMKVKRMGPTSTSVFEVAVSVAEWVRSLYFSALNHSIISRLCLV